MFRKLLLKIGLIRSIFAITIITIVISALLNLLISVTIGEIELISVMKAMVIPAIIAPFLSYAILSVLLRHENTKDALAQRLIYEKMLNNISALAISTMDIRIFLDRSLSIIGEVLDVSRIYIFEHRHETDTMDNTYEWCEYDITPQKEELQGIPSSSISWWMDEVKNNRVIKYRDVADIPGEVEKKILRRQNIKSVLVVPLFIRNEYFGFMGFDECRRYRDWLEEDKDILRTISQIVTGAFERNMSEEALNFERQQLLSIFNSINQPISVADTKTYEILYSNDYLKNLHGKELVGEICYREFQGFDSPCDFCPNEIILKNRYEPYRWELHNKKVKRDFMVINRIIKWPDGRDVRFEIAFDITEQKRGENALRESEELYRLLFNNGNDAAFVIQSLEGNQPDRYIDVNEIACHRYGYSREEFLKMAPENIHDKDKLRFISEIKKRLDKDGSCIYETIHVAKDGTKINVETSSRVFKLRDQKAVLSISRDITKRRHIEVEKMKLETQLLQAEKMKSLGTLAGSVAHDLNNVLSGIVAYPDLILKQIPEDNPLVKPILAIKESGEKAAAIVEDLLTLARRNVIITDIVNINTVIMDFSNSPEYKKLKTYHPDVEVEITLCDELPNISGSSVHLFKTVMNLFSNAVEAMPYGGTVYVSTENQYIDTPIMGYEKIAEGDYAVLSVTDEGIGIPAGDQKKIFEPFYTKKRMGKSGTGLGMAVVWGTVKDHKGYVDIISEEGKGSVFKCYFPITRQEAKDDEDDIRLQDYMGNNESILVVDDVESQRDMATSLLNTLGYSVHTVSSGEEAVIYMPEHSVDLIILDMIMDPGIDGLETYKRIIELHPGQKAIVASGFSETDSVREVQNLGAGQYIKKPYTLEKIALALRRELV